MVNIIMDRAWCAFRTHAITSRSLAQLFYSGNTFLPFLGLIRLAGLQRSTLYATNAAGRTRIERSLLAHDFLSQRAAACGKIQIWLQSWQPLPCQLHATAVGLPELLFSFSYKFLLLIHFKKELKVSQGRRSLPLRACLVQLTTASWAVVSCFFAKHLFSKQLHGWSCFSLLS